MSENTTEAAKKNADGTLSFRGREWRPATKADENMGLESEVFYDPESDDFVPGRYVAVTPVHS